MNAYHLGPKPEWRPTAQTNAAIVFVGLAGVGLLLFLRNIQSFSFLGGLLHFISWVGAALVAAAFMLVLERSQKRVHAETLALWVVHKRTADAYFAEVETLLERAREGRVGFFPDGLNLVYRIKKGEVVSWAGPATMNIVRDELVEVRYSGFGAHTHIVGGLHHSSGSARVREKRESQLVSEGPGTLLVTNQRLAFLSADMSGSNWIQTWEAVDSWMAFAEGITVNAGTGKPKVFLLPNSGLDPTSDTGLVDLLMHSAFNQET